VSVFVGAGWLKAHAWDSAAVEVYRGCVRTITTASPAELSMGYWLAYVKAAGRFAAELRLLGVWQPTIRCWLWVRFLSSGCLQYITENAQDYKFVGGSQLISIKLAEKLGTRVRLSSPVQTVKWAPSGEGTELCPSACYSTRPLHRSDERQITLSQGQQ
jgi:hypothetical protein